MNHPGIPGTSESAMPIPPVLQFVTQLLSTPLPRLTSAFPHRYIHPAAQTTSLPHLNFPHRQRHSLVPFRLAPCLPKSPPAEPQLAAPQLPPPPAPLSCPFSPCRFPT